LIMTAMVDVLGASRRSSGNRLWWEFRAGRRQRAGDYEADAERFCESAMGIAAVCLRFTNNNLTIETMERCGVVKSQFDVE